MSVHSVKPVMNLKKKTGNQNNINIVFIRI